MLLVSIEINWVACDSKESNCMCSTSLNWKKKNLMPISRRGKNKQLICLNKFIFIEMQNIIQLQRKSPRDTLLCKFTSYATLFSFIFTYVYGTMYLFLYNTSIENYFKKSGKPFEGTRCRRLRKSDSLVSAPELPLSLVCHGDPHNKTQQTAVNISQRNIF